MTTRAEFKALVIAGTLRDMDATFRLTGDGVTGSFRGGYTISVKRRVVGLAPVITSASTSTDTAGTFWSYTITADNSPTSFDATGLPSWASFSGATISGMPGAAEVDSITISATNAYGTDTRTLVLTVTAASGTRIVTHGPSIIAIDYPNGSANDAIGWASCVDKVVTFGGYDGDYNPVTTFGPTTLQPGDIPYYVDGVLRVEWALGYGPP